MEEVKVTPIYWKITDEKNQSHYLELKDEARDLFRWLRSNGLIKGKIEMVFELPQPIKF